MYKHKIAVWVIVLGCALLAPGAAQAEDAAPPEPQKYDPLRVQEGFKPEVLDLTVTDTGRTREIPLRVYLPEEKSAAPVLLFSHGLGGSRENSPYLGNHWAARGYVAVFLQHHGSDELVWKNEPLLKRLVALKQAASLQNLMLRVKDVPAALDQLAAWNGDKQHALHGRLDLARIGMSGHSFGGVTTQAVGGENFPLVGQSWTDSRIKAAVVFSPSAAKSGTPQNAFGKVSIPWLLMTGTRDDSPIGDADAASRLQVYPGLPPQHKYELVLDGAEHSAFGDRRLPGETSEHNPNHHRAILALSTAFWDSFLKHDAAAAAWLDGDGPHSVLQEKDRWQKK